MLIYVSRGKLQGVQGVLVCPLQSFNPAMESFLLISELQTVFMVNADVLSAQILSNVFPK